MSDQNADNNQTFVGNRFVFVYRRFSHTLFKDDEASVFRKLLIILVSPIIFILIPISYLLTFGLSLLKKLETYFDEDK